MSTDDNKALILRWWEALNLHSVAGLRELCGPDYVWHGPGIVGDRDLAGVTQTGRAFFMAFPDAHWTVDDLIA